MLITTACGRQGRPTRTDWPLLQVQQPLLTRFACCCCKRKEAFSRPRSSALQGFWSLVDLVEESEREAVNTFRFWLENTERSAKKSRSSRDNFTVTNRNNKQRQHRPREIVTFDELKIPDAVTGHTLDFDLRPRRFVEACHQRSSRDYFWEKRANADSDSLVIYDLLPPFSLRRHEHLTRSSRNRSPNNLKSKFQKKTTLYFSPPPPSRLSGSSVGCSEGRADSNYSQPPLP